MTDKTLAPAQTSTAGRTSDWRKVYANRLLLTDFLVLAWVVFGVQLLWFGFDSQNVGLRGDLSSIAISYTLISIVLVGAWLLILGLFNTRGYRVAGSGSSEYKLIFDASLRLFGLVAIVAFLFQVDLARGYVLLAFPFGVLVLVFSRWLWRQWLGMKRSQGTFSSRVVLVGSPATVRHVAAQLRSAPDAGYHVVGACVPEGRDDGLEPGIPVLGSTENAAAALDQNDADTLVITGSHDLPPQQVRRLSWELESGHRHLIMVPSMTDVAGPRIHTRPVAGLPLIHVEMPSYDGPKRYLKRALDLVGSFILLVLLSPLFLILTLLVKTTSQGPVFYAQERIGKRNTTFRMLKFRSMIINADDQLKALLAAQGTADKPLFKVVDDPRITKIGHFLRKYSLDELPQLINVLRGEMSLVGPRPQRAEEVALYDAAALRRLNVLPGMTGLWQVSGRSDLSWEDTVRLDLYYVENWSLLSDLVILWRTGKAVLARSGAY